MNPRLLMSAALAAAIVLPLGACGKQGNLERPPPMFGKAKREMYARQRAAARKAAGESNVDESATSQTNGDYSHGNDGAQDPALKPMRSAPIPGARPDPFSNPGAGGVLPDPYANPTTAPR